MYTCVCIVNNGKFWLSFAFLNINAVRGPSRAFVCGLVFCSKCQKYNVIIWDTSNMVKIVFIGLWEICSCNFLDRGFFQWLQRSSIITVLALGACKCQYQIGSKQKLRRWRLRCINAVWISFGTIRHFDFCAVANFGSGLTIKHVDFDQEPLWFALHLLSICLACFPALMITDH